MMARSVLSLCPYLLLLIPAVTLCKPQQGTQPQLAVLPGVEIVQPPSSNSSTTASSSDSPVPPAAAAAAATMDQSGTISNGAPGMVMTGSHASILPVVMNGSSPVQLHSRVDGIQQDAAVASCPRIYLPVCGSNSKTYNSPCELQVAQRSDSSLQQSKDGPC